MYVPLPFTPTTYVNAAGPAQSASSGPNRLNVIVPVGFTALVRVAVSATGSPTVALGGAWVVITGTALSTVVTSVPVPLPVSWDGENVAAEKATWVVWIFATAGKASLVGTPRTSKVSSMTQVSVAEPCGPRTTGWSGTNRNRRLGESISVTVKVRVAQALPAFPVAAADRRRAESTPPVHRTSGGALGGMPHEGTSVMSVSVAWSWPSPPNAVFTIRSDAGTPVAPTVTAAGNNRAAATIRPEAVATR